MVTLWPVAAGSLIASALGVGAMRFVATKLALLDEPNARSLHLQPTPRGGGIAIATLVLIALTISDRTQSGVTPQLGWIVGGSLVAIVGAIDDIWGSSVLLRLSVQLVSAAALLWSLHGLPALGTPFGSIALGAAGWIIGLGAVVWSTNLFNFMDGIDGLAAAQALFVFGASILVLSPDGRTPRETVPLLVLAASSAGFLAWNVSPFRIFMGDVGSGFLGFSVAAAALITTANGSASIWTWLILDGAFFADATATLLTRAARYERVHEAHRSHAYQRLAQRWDSHLAVTCCYSAVNLFWCLPWAIVSQHYPAEAMLCAVAAVGPMLLVARLLKAGHTLGKEAVVSATASVRMHDVSR